MKRLTIKYVSPRLMFGIGFCLLLAPSAFSEQTSSKNVHAPSSLSEVLEVVVQSNTKIQSFASRKEGLEGLVLQAGLVPNPQIQVELENYGGSLSGTDESEFTTSIQQLIETGGKRSARRNLAKSQKDTFVLEATTEIGEIIGNVKTAYQEVLFAQASRKLSEEGLKLAKDVYSAVEKKVKYGGVLNVELTKAELALSTAEIKLANATQTLDEAKNDLASYWGGRGGELGKLSSLPLSEAGKESFDDINIEQSPYFQLSKSRQETASTNLKHEKAMIYPDLTASVGYRKIEETNDNTLIGSLSVPLPFFNRNQGSVRNASRLEQAAKLEHTDNVRRLRSRLSNLKKRLTVQRREQELLKNSVLPQSKKALEQIKSAYSLGKVSYLDLLDSQSRYIEARERELAVSTSAYRSEVELQKFLGTVLLGLPIDMISQQKGVK